MRLLVVIKSTRHSLGEGKVDSTDRVITRIRAKSKLSESIANQKQQFLGDSTVEELELFSMVNQRM